MPENVRWLISSDESQVATRVNLICFPHAGAGPSLFARWKTYLPAEIRVHAVHLPGRESRLREPLVPRFEPLVTEISRAIAAHAERPIALFGYSMGALLAFEVARALERSGTRIAALFTAAIRAPHRAADRPKICRLNDADFVAALQSRYGGIPREILAEPELMRMFIPILRCDLELVENYVYEPGAPLTCPVRCFGGSLDTSVSRSELEAWAETTSGDFAFQEFAGDHFLIKEKASQLAATIARELSDIGR